MYPTCDDGWPWKRTRTRQNHRTCPYAPSPDNVPVAHRFARGACREGNLEGTAGWGHHWGVQIVADYDIGDTVCPCWAWFPSLLLISNLDMISTEWFMMVYDENLDPAGITNVARQLSGNIWKVLSTSTWSAHLAEWYFLENFWSQMSPLPCLMIAGKYQWCCRSGRLIPFPTKLARSRATCPTSPMKLSCNLHFRTYPTGPKWYISIACYAWNIRNSNPIQPTYQTLHWAKNKRYLVRRNVANPMLYAAIPHTDLAIWGFREPPAKRDLTSSTQP